MSIQKVYKEYPVNNSCMLIIKLTKELQTLGSNVTWNEEINGEISESGETN